MEERSIPVDDLSWVVKQLMVYYRSKFDIIFPPLNLKTFKERISSLLNLKGKK